MNLYLILALALGAISGGTAVPHAEHMAKVVAERGERCAVCGPASAGRLTSDRLKPAPTPEWRLAPRAPRLVTAPLAGAATPRAPARIG